MGTSGSLWRLEAMTNPVRYRVTFQITHPELTADEIETSFTLRPRYSRSVGSPKLTKNGKDLGGTYSKTDISFALSNDVIDNDMTWLTDFLENSLSDLPLSAIDRITCSGGTCYFLVGIFADRNIQYDFELPFLRQLVEHRIGLKLDFYGGIESGVTRI
jgi:hypothetical protein